MAIDLAVRDWSRREPTVAARLRRVDNRRMDYLRSLFSAFCTDEDDIEARGMLAFTLLIGSSFVAAEHGGRGRAEVLELGREVPRGDWLNSSGGLSRQPVPVAEPLSAGPGASRPPAVAQV